MTRRPVLSRRGYLGGLATATGIGIAGCLGDGDEEPTDDNDDTDDAGTDDSDPTDNGDDNDAEEPLEHSPSTFPVRRRAFQVGPDGGGIDFEALVNVGGEFTPEGLAYRDGHFYTGQREGPAWIREYTVDGERTGEVFEFDDVAINHTNTMDWVDDELWVSDSNTNTTYCVDWEEKQIVQEITHDDPAPGTWRAVVPTKTGEKKLLFCQWLGRYAWLVDLAGAREEGRTGPHFEKTLRNGFWSNPQTMEWIDGDLFVTTHQWIIKTALPYADQIPEGYPVTSYNVEWAYEFENHVTLEQMMYNHHDDEFYLVDRGRGGTIYAGRETYGEHRNAAFSRWDTTDASPAGERAINLNESGSGQLMLTNGYGEAKHGWVEGWFQPRDVEDTIAGMGVMSMTNDAYALGINHEVSNDTFAWHNGDDWEATDVPITTRDWVKFGFDVAPEGATGYVSTTEGNTWEFAARTEREDFAINRLWLSNQSGAARAAHWTLELRSADEP